MRGSTSIDLQKILMKAIGLKLPVWLRVIIIIKLLSSNSLFYLCLLHIKHYDFGWSKLCKPRLMSRALSTSFILLSDK